MFILLFVSVTNKTYLLLRDRSQVIPATPRDNWYAPNLEIPQPIYKLTKASEGPRPHHWGATLCR